MSSVFGQICHADLMFDREHEMQELEKCLDAPPGGIIVLVGPRNSGKSLLLSSLLDSAKYAERVKLINCRMVDVTTPDGFARAMLEDPDDSFLKSWSSSKVATDWIGMIAGAAGASKDLIGAPQAAAVGLAAKSFLTLTSRVTDPSVPPLAKILEAYNTVFERVAKTGLKPVLVVDEANRLARWRPDHSAALEQLFCFFIASTKEKGLSHVILATSDYGFIEVVEQSRCFDRTCALLEYGMLAAPSARFA